MPFLVLIVDELADLMMVAGFEVEQNLVRSGPVGPRRWHPPAAGYAASLGQRGYRPSQGQHPGPLRLRRIGAGGLPRDPRLRRRGEADGQGRRRSSCTRSPSRPERMQGALVYDEEIEVPGQASGRSRKARPFAAHQPGLTGEDDEDGAALGMDVSQMDQARDLAARNPNLSVSILQRRLKVGGNRAEEILEELEEEGYLTPR